MQTRRLPAHGTGPDEAAALLAQGQLVAFPTETVYGLGGDATDNHAVASIFAAKGRPGFNPLIVHVADIDTARTLVDWPVEAGKLAEAFWPGPLTLVLALRAGHGLSAKVTAGLPTVAVRIPAHPVARALLHAFGKPVAAPSANPSGKISATTPQHVIDGLDGRISAVLDDGPCPVGLESTIVGLSDHPRLLRPGGVPAEAIEAVLGSPLAGAGNGISAPGQLSSHYAPEAAVRLCAVTANPGEFHLGFGPVNGDLNLSGTADLSEAARNLFDHLHEANRSGKPIAIAPIPDHGLGRAINDRLRRAAATE